MSDLTQLNSMLGCLYKRFNPQLGLIECIKFTQTDLRFVVSRVLSPSVYIPSRFITPHSLMMESAGFQLLLDGKSFKLRYFDYLPTDQYLSSWTDLQSKGKELIEKWAADLVIVLDAQRLTNEKVAHFKSELVAKVLALKNREHNGLNKTRT